MSSWLAQYEVDTGSRQGRRLPGAPAQIPAGEIVQFIAEGRTSKDIAQQLGLSVKTVDAHRANVMRKLDLHSVSELVRYGARNQT